VTVMILDSEEYKFLEAELAAVREELILVKAERNKMKLELARIASQTIKETTDENSSPE